MGAKEEEGNALIAQLSGKIIEKDDRSVVLDVGGVGYRLFMSTNSLSQVPSQDSSTTVYTYLYVREDAMQLFGFTSLEEKELFENLVSVSGIGPKVALAVLSTFSPVSLKKAIITEDLDLITAVPGIGKKSAGRLVVELKDKLVLPELELVSSSGGKGKDSAYSQVRAALVGLGYTTAEATRALEGYPSDKEMSIEEMVKYGLKNLAR